MTRTLDLRRSTTKLVVDHHTVHHAREVVSIHYLERDAEDRTTGGGDIDGVTAVELGVPGDLTSGLTPSALCAFVANIADVPTETEVAPPPVVVDEPVAVAEGAAS